MRKNMRQSTEEKRVQKTKTLSENFEFVWAKNRYGGDEKKKGKEEERKEECDQEQNREKKNE